MIKTLYKIKYCLTLLDRSFMETTTNVVDEDLNSAKVKLEAYRRNTYPPFEKIEIISIEKIMQVIC